MKIYEFMWVELSHLDHTGSLVSGTQSFLGAWWVLDTTENAKPHHTGSFFFSTYLHLLWSGIYEFFHNKRLATATKNKVGPVYQDTVMRAVGWCCCFYSYLEVRGSDGPRAGQPGPRVLSHRKAYRFKWVGCLFLKFSIFGFWAAPMCR